jgi:ERCC4-type nuclease
MPELAVAKGENSLCVELLALKVPYRMEPLPLADMVIRSDGASADELPLILIERKTVNDLMASIRDGRYKEQSHRLAETGRPVWWIIEGKQSGYRRDPQDPARLCSAISSLGLLRGFTPVRTLSTAETALLVQKLLAKAAEMPRPSADCDMAAASAAAATPEYSHPHKRFKADCITRDNIQVMMLAQVPGVSVTRAQAILNAIPLADILNGVAIPKGLKSSSGPGKDPRTIPKNVLAAIEDYLHPKQSA